MKVIHIDFCTLSVVSKQTSVFLTFLVCQFRESSAPLDEVDPRTDPAHFDEDRGAHDSCRLQNEQMTFFPVGAAWCLETHCIQNHSANN